jgi:hypothetical protein
VTHRRLLNEFYEALHPPFYSLGTLDSLDVFLIPEWTRAVAVVIHWTQELAYTLDFRSRSQFTLTHLIRGARLSFELDIHHASMYWSRSPCLNPAVNPYIRPGGSVLAGDIVCWTESQHPNSILCGILAIMCVCNLFHSIHRYRFYTPF